MAWYRLIRLLLVDDINALQTQLADYLTMARGHPVVISDLTPLPGGASRDTWAFTATWEGQAQRLVMRRDLPTQMNPDALSRAQEFRLMAAAHQSGVQVARVYDLCEDPAVLGFPFFTMEAMPGISIGRKVVTAPELAAAREVLPEQLAEQLARIHTMNAADLDFLPHPTDDNPVRSVIDQTYATLARLGASVPAFEFALRWADRHAPASQRITVLHGDFRIGNMLVDADGLSAVIDWEFAHIGDPLEEIGYLCMRDWRFGMGHLRAGGISDRERFIRAYEQASGSSVDRSAADWWEIVGNIRWGVICLAQADRHLSGQEQSVELLSLGRRSAEMQMEALRLIQQTGAA